MGVAGAPHPFTELKIEISRDRVAFKVGRKDYEGEPLFTDDLLAELERVREEGDAEQYGSYLFEALFPKGTDIREGYVAARDAIQQQGAQFRLRLKLDRKSRELLPLWWETLYDTGPPPSQLARLRATPLSRYLSGLSPGPVESDRLKVLVVVASPPELDTDRWPELQGLSRDEETAPIHKAFEKLAGRVECIVHKGRASPSKIRERLRDEHFHVLHLVCHGSYDQKNGYGYVLLEDEDERSACANAAGAKLMTQLINDLGDLQLVVLASCHSANQAGGDALKGLAPMMMAADVPAVVAMQQRVTEVTARRFTQIFYQSLTSELGGYVDVAANFARDQLLFEGDEWGWATPVVFLRGDGHIYKPPPEPEVDQGAAAVRLGPPGEVLPMTPQPPVTRGPIAEPAVGVTIDLASDLLKQLTIKHNFTDAEIGFLAACMETWLDPQASTVDKAKQLVEWAEMNDRLAELQVFIPRALVKRRKSDAPRNIDLGQALREAS
jgi:CHAT domain